MNSEDATKPFTKILVALRQNEPVDYTRDALVIRRALELADAFGAALHFCDVVQKPVPMTTPLAIYQTTDHRASLLDHAESRMARLVAHIKSTGVEQVDGSIVVDRPRPAGIIEQAQSCGADLILKQSRDENFILGIFSNTDWDLLRDSPIPVWLTSSDSSPRDGVMAAIECRLDEGKEQRLFLDQRVFAVSKLLSDQLSAPLQAVHAYQVDVDGYMPIYTEPDALSQDTLETISDDIERQKQRVGRLHGDAIQTFVDATGVPLDKIVIGEGPTAQVLKEAAAQHKVGLLVMGADEGVGRWDRLLQSVHAEPTLDNAPCDILFVH